MNHTLKNGSDDTSYVMCLFIYFFYHSKSKIVQCLVHLFGFTNEETKTERGYVTKAISHRDIGVISL